MQRSDLRAQRKKRYQGISAVLEDALTPEEYCKKWVPVFYGVQPDERGFRKHAVEELSKITGFQPTSINNWGKGFANAPSWVHRMLKMADILNQSSHDWQNLLDDH